MGKSVATSEIYLLDSEVRVCDECKTRDVTTVKFKEGIDRLKAIGNAGRVIDVGGNPDTPEGTRLAPNYTSA
ncbi:hypothetical protein Bca52824_039008 [Brassica carinata]|uniref:Uncharacterized protein n=1 Tax=Brassica carinata TaxID=52824 RepID=A0A8X7RNG3_BRACI|nr:hypothetical protein Bca52824_039008 [Brassica carinata]